MGFEIAKMAEKLGAEVVLISGPSSEQLSSYSTIKRINITSAQDMYNAVFEYYADTDIAIMSAAVADYRPAIVSETKIKKEEDTFFIELVKM